MVLRRILVLGKHPDLQQLCSRIARETLIADDLNEAVDIASTANPDLILLDGAGNIDDIRTFLEITAGYHRVPVIVVGADEQSILPHCDSIHYLPNVADTARLEQIVTRGPGLVSRVSRDEARGTPANPDKSGQGQANDDFFVDELAAAVSMAGKSGAIRHTLKMIKLVAGSSCNPVLITGETGTGKELAAKAVHIYRHPNEKFVAVNCAALTATLLESELFGHVKGSFTGAERDKTGLLELAGRGAIFLDEISEMPLDLQAKLLRVLQEKTFRKVGGTEDKTCRATIIASSNRNLRQEVNANRFRRDLYYRLNICPITIAPLRDPQRCGDIRLLAGFFLKNSTVSPHKAGKITALTEMAVEALEEHNWPGNVRELRNVIERAILLETTDKIGLSSILIDSEIEAHVTETETRFGMVNGNGSDFSLEKAERELIARALQESGWQKTKAAALLGITRATLYAKVKQHNIQKGTYIPVLEPVIA